MYVSPVHAIMIFHNVETNEEIWDYKAKDGDLQRVVKENIVGVVGIEAKKAAAAQREREWEELLRDRCVCACSRCGACVALPHPHLPERTDKRSGLCSAPSRAVE